MSTMESFYLSLVKDINRAASIVAIGTVVFGKYLSWELRIPFNQFIVKGFVAKHSMVFIWEFNQHNSDITLMTMTYVNNFILSRGSKFHP